MKFISVGVHWDSLYFFIFDCRIICDIQKCAVQLEISVMSLFLCNILSVSNLLSFYSYKWIVSLLSLSLSLFLRKEWLAEGCIFKNSRIFKEILYRELADLRDNKPNNCDEKLLDIHLVVKQSSVNQEFVGWSNCYKCHKCFKFSFQQ